MTNSFIKNIQKKQLMTLIYDKQKFEKEIIKILKRKFNKDKRRKMFSIHINSSRISIVLFGKQFMEIG